MNMQTNSEFFTKCYAKENKVIVNRSRGLLYSITNIFFNGEAPGAWSW